MNKNSRTLAPVEVKVNVRAPRQAPLRGDADAVLRDIAFVLKMTQRVRDQIDTESTDRKPLSV